MLRPETNIRNIDRSALKQRSSVKIPKDAPRHERMAELIPEPVDAVVFNLGWLPGAEHGVTTRVETTLQAVEAALSVLKEDGIMTVCIYPGHDEGARELRALIRWAETLDPLRYDALIKTYLNQPNDPPRMLAVKKKRTRRR